MCETMMRLDMDIEASQAHIKEIADMIKPIDYLHPVEGCKGNDDRVLAVRGADWLRGAIGYHVDQGFSCGTSLAKMRVSFPICL